MQFFRKPNINFIGNRRWAFLLSGLLILAGAISLILKGGPKYGIDFTGGTLVQIHLDNPVDIGAIRSAISPLGLASAEIQNFGEASEFLIKYQKDVDPSFIAKEIKEKLGENVRIDRTEKVGPRIGKELRERAFIFVFVGLLLMLIYITIRFDIKFGVGAVLALFHDVFITLGILSIFNKEITVAIVAALLTIVGYSINDSIVVSDRIRENLRKLGKTAALNRFTEIVNRSINETLSRTVITSLTTLVVLIAVLIFGGPVIFDFAFALTIGVIVGTYSSIFVVASLVVEWESWRKRKK